MTNSKSGGDNCSSMGVPLFLLEQWLRNNKGSNILVLLVLIPPAICSLAPLLGIASISEKHLSSVIIAVVSATIASWLHHPNQWFHCQHKTLELPKHPVPAHQAHQE